MKVSIIGTGNCATVLLRLCRAHGHTITEVIGRSPEKGIRLAAEANAPFTLLSAPMNLQTDIFIAAISDSAVIGALEGMHFGGVPVVHTAGSVSIHVLQNLSANYGVLYPVQSLSKDATTLPEIPFVIEANNDYTTNLLSTLAHSISREVHLMNEEQRLRLHTAAVIVNNFTNYLYDVAKKFCKQESIDFDLLKPLIFETAERIRYREPEDLQTGPAIRKDITTLDKHLRLLSAYPKLRTMYMRMTDGIMNP